MPTTTLMPLPKQQFLTAHGTPLAGGKVYTYAAGTSQRKETYTDPDGTKPQQNPIPLNLRGEPESPIYWSGNYRVEVRSKLGYLIYTVDNFNTDPAGFWGAVGTAFNNLASNIGASLVGFIQDGAGAVLRTLRDKNREVISPEDFGAKGDGVHDDAPAFQAAIDSFPRGASCAVRLSPNKTYMIRSTVSTNFRSVVIDGNNAIVLLGTDMDYGIKVIGTNCELRNFQVNRSGAAVVTAGIYISGLQHVLRNVTSRAQTWTTFILCQDMKESHITNLRVDNDVSENTGTIIHLDYCVNNTISNSMLGFCSQAIYGSGNGQPVSNYHNEGIMISDVITVYAGKAVNFDNGTFIAISNCCFDFCEIWGVFVSNGTDLTVMGSWIASNTTNGFIGIGSGANVKGVTAQGNTIVRGAAAITDTAGFSLPGIDALVMGNRLKFGMNGGTVTHPTSQVIGNSVGGTPIFSDESAVSVRGSVAISKQLVVDGTLTVGGSTGIFPSSLSGSASAGAVGTVTPPATVAAFAEVKIGGVDYKLPLYNP